MAAILTLSIGASSCGNIKALGLGRWPIYKLPPATPLSKAEKEVIGAFAKDHPAAYGKIHRQFLAYREIVVRHNAKAREVNRRQLKALGYSDDDVRRLYPKERKSGP